MATSAELQQVRQMIDEPSTSGYWTDARLGLLIDASPSLESVAAQVWRMKAAKGASLVDVSEGQSRRSMSQIHAQALKMAEHYESVAVDAVGGSTSRGRARTRPIERA